MEGRSNGGSSEADVVPFEPAASTPGHTDQLDAAGETILRLIHRAAGVAEENSRHAVEMAQKLSHQLRASEDRVAQLEVEAATYRRTCRSPASGSRTRPHAFTHGTSRPSAVRRGRHNRAYLSWLPHRHP
jgi:hypothetical protein